MLITQSVVEFILSGSAFPVTSTCQPAGKAWFESSLACRENDNQRMVSEPNLNRFE